MPVRRSVTPRLSRSRRTDSTRSYSPGRNHSTRPTVLGVVLDGAFEARLTPSIPGPPVPGELRSRDRPLLVLRAIRLSPPAPPRDLHAVRSRARHAPL